MTARPTGIASHPAEAVGDAKTLQRAEVWSRYWATGAAHSLEGSLPADYGHELGGDWMHRFSALPAGSTVLDVCTGSGVLARLAHSTRNNLHISAIDIVPQAPPWFQSVANDPRVRFLGSTGAESVPLADGSQRLVVSQFGIEYCDRVACIKELRRLLHGDGAMVFVVHASDSASVQVAKADAGALHWLLDDDGLVAAWMALLPWIARMQGHTGVPSAAERASADAARLNYNAKARAAQSMAAQGSSDVPLIALERLATALAPLASMPPPEQAAAAQRVRQSYQDAALRTQELVSCAMSESEATAFSRQLADALGWAARVEPALASGHLIGWRIEVGKRTQ